jgi:anti-sigma factor RsiW
MNCDRTEEISRLIDGEMAPAEARAVERHLNECVGCGQVREDFLTLRSQITSYQTALDPAATRQALAKVVSSQGALTSAGRATKRSSGSHFPGVFGSLRFNPVFVTALGLLLTGAIAFSIYRAQQENHSGASLSPVAQNSADKSSHPASASGSEAVAGSSNLTGSDEQLADNSNRKTRKVGSREPGTIRRKSSSPVRPSRERDVPKPPPARSAAPPTYARLNERLMPGGNELTLAVDPASGNLRHLEQSELLLRSFRNIRFGEKGGAPDVSYERRLAQQLVYQNMLLRREADTAGNIEVATLLGSLEPILLDIANLRTKPRNEEVRVIRERVERQSLVPLLQVSSVAVLRSNEERF